MTNAVAKDAQSLGVEATFRALFQPVAPKEFGSAARQASGLSDRAPGLVQWSAWYDHKHQVALLAVNLEGMKGADAEWPIGRLIQRELAQARFPDVFATYGADADIEATWDRDAWVIYRVPIKEKEILHRPVQRIDSRQWHAALVDAAACLGDGLRGRATQMVTLPHKGPRELPVSPHLQFRTPVWSLMPSGHQARVALMAAKRDRLEPLHQLAVELTAHA